MEFRIPGPLQVSAGDGALKVGGPKQRAVLAHLILRANHPVPVERLIDGLWGEEPPETAKNTLRTYAHLYLMRGDASELYVVGFGITPSWHPETP